MKKKYIVFIVAVVLVSVLSVFFLNNAFYISDIEKDNSYEITSFVSSIIVNDDNSISVVEDLRVVYYDDYKHGIIRALPTINYITYTKNGKKIQKNYKVAYSSIHASSLVDYYNEDGFYYIQIGDAYDYVDVLKPYNYQIKYTMTLGDDREDEFDFFYFNVIGNDWNAEISNISFDISFVKKIQNEKLQLYIADQDEVVLNLDENGTHCRYYYNGSLMPGEALTIRSEMENGYFRVSSVGEQTRNYDILLLGVVLLLMLIVFIIKKTTSIKKDLITIVEFQKPDDLNSAEVGYLIDGEMDDHDVVSLIVHWANKGYLKIKEENKKIYLTKLKDIMIDNNNYNAYEKKLFDKIFERSDKDVLIDHIGSECYNQIQQTVLAIKNKQDAEMFSQKARNGRNISAILVSVIAFVVSTFVNNYLYLLNGFIFNFAFAILIYFSLAVLMNIKDNEFTVSSGKLKLLYLMWAIVSLVLIVFYINACFDLNIDMLGVKIFVGLLYFVAAGIIATTNIRSSIGVDKLGRLVGLREYIEKAEKDKLEYLAEENPSAFYDILPYAYVLGVCDVWIKKFEDIKIQNPAWLETDMDNYLFTNYYFSNLLINSLITTQKNITIQRTSKQISTVFGDNGKSGSGGNFGGFSGGGFSGGGFGGGGGSSW